MNLKSIADGIATELASLTATNGSLTETVSATADLPNAVGKLALLVYPPTGDLGMGPGKRRADTYEFPVRLLRDPLNAPARTQWLYAWFNALRDEVEKNMDLGLSYVAWASPVSLRMTLDGEEYSSADGTFAAFDVVELIVRVRVDEVVSTVAT